MRKHPTYKKLFSDNDVEKKLEVLKEIDREVWDDEASHIASLNFEYLRELRLSVALLVDYYSEEEE